MSGVIKHIVGPTIAMQSGHYFDFAAPDPGSITITDIARALGNTCRFGGHTSRFYSVAEHSFWVSEIVPPEDALVGLMHDAPEAFVGDIPKPLKSMLPDFAIVEARVERAVFDRFRLPLPLPASVKAGDLAMLRAEQTQAMGNGDDWSSVGGVAAADVRLQFWTPEAAAWRFLQRYEELVAGRPT